MTRLYKRAFVVTVIHQEHLSERHLKPPAPRLVFKAPFAEVVLKVFAILQASVECLRAAVADNQQQLSRCSRPHGYVALTLTRCGQGGEHSAREEGAEGGPHEAVAHHAQFLTPCRSHPEVALYIYAVHCV